MTGPLCSFLSVLLELSWCRGGSQVRDPEWARGPSPQGAPSRELRSQGLASC